MYSWAQTVMNCCVTISKILNLTYFQKEVYFMSAAHMWSRQSGDAPPRKPKFRRSGKHCILTQAKIFFKPNRGTFDIQTKPSNGFNGLFIKNNKKWCVAQSRVPGVSNEIISFMLMSNVSWQNKNHIQWQAKL